MKNPKQNLFLFSILLLSALIPSCISSDKNTENPVVRELAFDEGIYTEVYDFVNDTIENEPDWFNRDNKIYKEGNEFYFRYSYLKGKDSMILIRLEGERVDLLRKNESDSLKKESKISKVRISVTPNRKPFDEMSYDYSQTVIQYNFVNELGEIVDLYNKTGVIENDMNIWMHPSRTGYLKIFELNPFPFIQKPFSVGNRFKWDMTIGDGWSDVRWKSWQGSIHNFYEYEITAEENVDLSFGKVPCYKTEAKAESRIGRTYLTSWFNEKLGFVKLEYTNIDSSRIVFVLDEVKGNINL